MPRSFLFVLTLLTFSLGLNIDLAWKIKTMRSPGPPPSKVGMQVGHFTATDQEGHLTDVSFNAGKPTLIYFIDPECHWCKANSASFATLARAIDGRVRVLILSRRAEKLEQFLNVSRPPATVLILNSGQLIRDLGLTGTPQTFVVNASGRVEQHWLGAYTGHTRAEIEKTFGLNLPELKDPS